MIQLLKTTDEQYFEDLINISDLQLGAGFMKMEDLQKMLHHHHVKIHIKIIDNQVVGYKINLGMTKKELREWLPNYQDEILSLFPGDRMINWHKTTAVHPDFVSKRVGTELFSYALKNPPAKSLYWLSVAWAPGGIAHVGKLMAKHNFVCAFEAKEYWKEDSLKLGYQCEECGDPPCTCSALIYYKL